MSKKEKFILYDKIVERAKSLNLLNDEKRCHMMDVESADLHFNMRLQEWLDADNLTLLMISVVSEIILCVANFHQRNLVSLFQDLQEGVDDCEFDKQCNQ